MPETQSTARSDRVELLSQAVLLRDSARLDLQLQTAVRQGPPSIDAFIPHRDADGASDAPTRRRSLGVEVRRRARGVQSRLDAGRLARRARPAAATAFALARPVMRPVADRWRTFVAEATVVPLRARTEEIAAVLHGNQQEMLRSLAVLTHQVEQLAADTAKTRAVQDQLAAAVAELTRAHAQAAETLPTAEGALLDLAGAIESVRAAQGEAVDTIGTSLGMLAELTAAGVRRTAVPVSDGATMVRAEVGYVLCPSDDPTLLACLLDTGTLERGTGAVLEAITAAGDRVVDVGAHIGLHTVAVARKVGPDGQVIALEPNPATCDLLRRTLHLNGLHERVTVHEVAASRSASSAELHLGLVSGHHSLQPLPPGDRQDDGATVTVETTRLDTLVEPDDGLLIVKIDAEAEELNVLAGMEGLIAAQGDLAVVAEFGASHLARTDVTPEEWLARFAEAGSEARIIDEEDGTVHPIEFDHLSRLASANLLFARPDSRIWERLG